MGETALVGLEINAEETSTGVPVLHLQGEIDLHTCPQLRVLLVEYLEARRAHIVLDLAQVPYLDSAALGVLVDAVRRAREINGALHLVHMTPFVRRAFEITRLIKIFQVHDSVDAALASIAAKSANSGNGAPPPSPAA